jgi:hypothetical protein
MTVPLDAVTARLPLSTGRRRVGQAGQRAGGLMTAQTGRNREIWRRVVIGGIAGSALAAGLLTGVTAPTALAQPAEPTTETEAPPAAAGQPGESCTGDDCAKPEEATMTADQALAIIKSEYDLGEGGGQLSQLIHDVMKLRDQGFRPSNENKLAIQDALEHRPNQTPLIEALKETLAYQHKLQARAEQSSSSSGPAAGPVPVLPGMTGPPG